MTYGVKGWDTTEHVHGRNHDQNRKFYSIGTIMDLLLVRDTGGYFMNHDSHSASFRTEY